VYSYGHHAPDPGACQARLVLPSWLPLEHEEHIRPLRAGMVHGQLQSHGTAHISQYLWPLWDRVSDPGNENPHVPQ